MPLKYDIVAKINCQKEGTGFFIDKKRVLTTRHTIEHYFDKNENIILETYNEPEHKIFKCKLLDADQNLDVALIEIEGILSSQGFFDLNAYNPIDETNWTAIGFPICDKELKLDRPRKVSGKVSQYLDSSDCIGDITLASQEVNNGWQDGLEGFSGSYVIVNDLIQGIILEAEYSNFRTPFRAISIAKIKSFLEKNGVSCVNIKPKTEMEMLVAKVCEKTVANKFLDANNYDKIYRIIDKKFEEWIKNGKLSKLETTIMDLLESEESQSYPNVFIELLICKLGKAYLIQCKKDDIDKCLNRILKMNEISQIGYKFMLAVALLKHEKELFNKAIEGLKICAVLQSELNLYMLQYELSIGNVQKIISDLISDGILIKEYNKNKFALELVGEAYFKLQDYINASKYLRCASEIEQDIKIDFLIVASEIYESVGSIGSNIYINTETKNILNVKYKTLRDMEYYFKENAPEIILEYWYLRLMALLVVAPESFIIEYDSLFENIKSNYAIRSLYADYLAQIGDAEKAIEEYSRAYKESKNNEDLLKLMLNLYNGKKFQDVINTVEVDGILNFDDDGRIASVYILAVCEISGSEVALERANQLVESQYKVPFLFQEIAKMQHHLGMNEEAKASLNNMMEAIPEDYYLPRINMAKTCMQLKESEIALSIIKPLLRHTILASEVYIDILLSCGKNEMAKQHIDMIVSKGHEDRWILERKKILAIEEKDYKTALYCLEKMFEIKKDLSTAYNICAVDLSYGVEINESDEAFKYLKECNEPEALMLVAIIYDQIGNITLKEYYSIKSLLKLNNEFNEGVFEKFINLYLLNGSSGDNEIVDIERITQNQGIILKCVNGINPPKMICLHAEKDIIENGKIFANYQHYTISSKVGIILKNRKLNEIVLIDGVEFKITSIMDRKAVFIPFCIEQYVIKCPNSAVLKSYQISKDNPLESILPPLYDLKKHNEIILRQYNNISQCGLSIYTFSDKNYQKYLDVMYYLLNTEKQVYYSGEVNLINNEDPIIVSFSSLLLLNIIGQLNLLNTMEERLIVPSSLKKVVKSIFDGLGKSELRTAGIMGVDDNGKPYLMEVTESQKEMRYNFWRELVLFLENKNIAIIEASTNDTTLKIDELCIDFFGIVDIEAMRIAVSQNAVLLADDLCFRKMYHAINNTGRSTNIISILFAAPLEISELLDILIKLSEALYCHLISEEIMYQLISKISLSPIVFGKGTLGDKLKIIVDNQFKNPIIYQSALLVICNTINTLYDDPAKAGYISMCDLLLEILAEVSAKYNIDKKRILQMLLNASPLEIVKEKYFKHKLQ